MGKTNKYCPHCYSLLTRRVSKQARQAGLMFFCARCARSLTENEGIGRPEIIDCTPPIPPFPPPGGLCAVKRDTDKLRYDLLPAFPLETLVKVLTFGARKYSDRNWEQGFKYSRVFAALLRHVWAFWSGETHDKETGLHHLAHAACNCFFLIEFSKTGKGEDDRPCMLK